MTIEEYTNLPDAEKMDVLRKLLNGEIKFSSTSELDALMNQIFGGENK